MPKRKSNDDDLPLKNLIDVKREHGVSLGLPKRKFFFVGFFRMSSGTFICHLGFFYLP